MLPLTTHQVNDGVDAGDFMIDLSDYMKKQDAATKTDITTLTEILANKLDATPQHKHDIADVKDLREELDSKYDTSKQYSYNVILSDSEKIPYLEAPRVGRIDISCNAGTDGYIFYVDDKSGDLMITLNDVLIGSYSIAAGKWSFETDTTAVETKIDSVEDIINQYIAKTDAVLKNHYDAILLLCQKHGMVDGDGDEGNNITPEDEWVLKMIKQVIFN